ncbi:type II secretion system major pseudopilin GspG [Lacimicrobium sp. SS2-24]|uniref:type II secretion system major pseudopilin GspG n=1 Tax=Lacimicrobium sp. SS2-24 TaxID=2005569 RepID=UPI000B4AEC37|nr:type II secretion system major pseudopilin GspG [Lacimicrobium sp. SS2-24]
MQKRRVSGFTLVELLIVIVIIGLLGSLVAPEMFSKVGSSKQSTAKAQMQMFETSLDTYYLDVGTYPQSLNELWRSDKDGWDGPYVRKELPNDPWGNAYQLEVPGPNGMQYRIRSLGRDGQPGGEGEDADIEVGR